MPKLQNVTSSELLKFFFKNGFELHHQKGSHIQLKNGKKKLTIPHHPKKTLNIKTVISIFKQSGIDKEDFLSTN